MTALPRILFAWEMGENYGHVSKITEIAGALLGKAELFAAVRNPMALRQMAPELPITLLAGPAAPHPKIAPGDGGQSYPDVLRHVGWGRPEDLGALAEAWRNLFALVQPDVLVTQAAPSALLAARGLGLSTASVGGGYDCPPRAHPMPAFFHWDPKAGKPPIDREAEVLATANRVLGKFDAPALGQFQDLLRTDAYLITAFAECDHYAPRTRFETDHPPYLGHVMTQSKGAAMAWRKDAKHRILAYLRPESPAFAPTVQALARLDQTHDVILAAPRAPAGLDEKLSRTAVRLHAGPVRLDGLLPDCNLGISHASNGIGGAFIMAGVPQLGVPGHAEQIMYGYAIGRARLGMALVGKFGPDEVSATIESLLTSAEIRKSVKIIGKRVRTEFKGDPSQRVARRILALA